MALVARRVTVLFVYRQQLICIDALQRYQNKAPRLRVNCRAAESSRVANT